MRSYKEQTEKILELVEKKKKAREKKNNILVTCSALAACAIIALFCTSLFSGKNQSASLPVDTKIFTPKTATTSDKSDNKTKPTKKRVNYEKPKTTTIPMTTESIKTTTTKNTPKIVFISTNSDKSLPSNDLSKTDSNVIIYNGKSYVNTCSLEESETSKANLLGEYLGTVSEESDDESTDDASSDDSSSDMNGKVYTINGYSESFRLGMVTRDTTTGNDYIHIFDDLDSLAYSVQSSGSELLNDILHIDKNLSFINYYSGTNLSEASTNQNDILTKIPETTIPQFIECLNTAFLINDGESAFENEDKKVALFFNMTDETTAQIYLTKDGYIFCDGLYFKTDSDIFYEVYNSLVEE